MAAYYGHVKAVGILLENGADITLGHYECWTPLKSAARQGHIDFVRILLGSKGDVNGPYDQCVFVRLNKSDKKT